MAVRADHSVAREHQPLFRHQRVLDAHLAHVVIVRDALSDRKVLADAALLGRLDVLAGRKVIHDQCDLLPVEHAREARALEFADCHRGRDVVSEHQIQPAGDEFSGRNGGLARLLSQNFLCEGHSHTVLPPKCPKR